MYPMIKVQIIDNTEQIEPALFDVEIGVSLDVDEVRGLNTIEKQQPSVVLLNYAVRKEHTAEYIKLILDSSETSKVVIVADGLSEKQILNCLTAGAKGYQEINQLETYANKLVKVIDAGEAWITRRMVAVLLDSLIKK